MGAATTTVFSAHAEVVPLLAATLSVITSILRARGGSSVLPLLYGHDFQYSPRTRR